RRGAIAERHGSVQRLGGRCHRGDLRGQRYRLSGDRGVRSRGQGRGRRRRDEDLPRHVEEIRRDDVDAGTADVGPTDAEEVGAHGTTDEGVRNRWLADVAGRRPRRKRIPLQKRPDLRGRKSQREVAGGRDGGTPLLTGEDDGPRRGRDETTGAEW